MKTIFTLALAALCLKATSAVCCHDTLKIQTETTAVINSETFEMIVDTIRKYVDVDIEKAIFHGVRAKEKAYSMKDSSKIVTAHRMMAQLFNRISMGSKAETELNQIFPFYEKYASEEDRVKIFNNLGIAYSQVGKYPESLRAFLKCKEACSMIGDTVTASAAEMNLAILYLYAGDAGKSVSHSLQALAMYSSGQEWFGGLLSNIGMAYLDLKQYDDAEIFFQKALSVCDTKGCLKTIRADVANGLGQILLQRGNDKEAKTHFYQALTLSKKEGHRRHEANAHYQLAKVFNTDTSKSLRHLLAAKELALSINNRFFLSNIYKQLSEVYFKTEDFANAFRFLRLATELRDSVQNHQVGAQIAMIEVENDEKERQAKFESQAKLLSLNQEIIKSQKQGLVGFSFAAMLLVVLVVVLSKHLIVRNEMNKILQRRVHERTLELQRQLKTNIEAQSRTAEAIITATSSMRAELATLKGLLLAEGNDVNLKEQCLSIDQKLLDRLMEVRACVER